MISETLENVEKYITHLINKGTSQENLTTKICNKYGLDPCLFGDVVDAIYTMKDDEEQLRKLVILNPE